MPLLKIPLLDDETWSLTDHRGQVVAMNYWASWCIPCWEETPMLVRLQREFGAQGLVIVGVAMDERSSNEAPLAVKHFVKVLQVNYPIGLSAPMSQMAYGMEGLPVTILIDRKGRVARTYVGVLNESAFRNDLKALLKEPAP